MIVNLLACLLFIVLCNIKVECTLYDRYEQMLVESRNLTSNNWIYYNLKYIRKLCPNDPAYCPISNSNIRRAYNTENFLYKTCNYLNCANVTKVGGFNSTFFPLILTGTQGEVSKDVLKFDGNDYYFAALVHKLSLVSYAEDRFALFAFEVRVAIGKNVANAEEAVSQLSNDTSFKNLISAPYQAVSGTTYSNSIGSNQNRCIKATTIDKSTTYEISNTAYWFNPSSNLLDTKIGSISNGLCTVK